MSLSSNSSQLFFVAKVSQLSPIDFKIESKELNWKAESKIGSLEKAANYVPAGGNVKVSHHTLPSSYSFSLTG